MGEGSDGGRPRRARASGRALSPLQRDALVRVWSEGKVLSLLRDRLVAAALRGRPPGPEASVRKALADDHGQHVMGLAKDLAGTAGVLAGTGPFGAGGARRAPSGPTASSTPRRSPSAAGPRRSSATSSPSGSSGCRGIPAAWLTRRSRADPPDRPVPARGVDAPVTSTV